MVKLRLTRLGKKKCPIYRIAAMEALGKRDGKAVAYVGSYNPLTEFFIVSEKNRIRNKFDFKIKKQRRKREMKKICCAVLCCADNTNRMSH